MNSGSRTRRTFRSLAATVAFGVVALAPTAAHADPDPYVGLQPPSVSGIDVGTRPQAASDPPRSQSAGVGLAVTGSDLLPLTAIGLGALGAGAALVRNGRRRQAR